MKFDRTFESHLTNEWRQQYVNYEEMKTLLRTAVENMPNRRDKSVYEEYCLNFQDEYFAKLNSELMRVNEFFDYKMAEARRKHATLKVKLLYMKSRTSGQVVGAVRGLPPLADQPRNLRKLDRAYAEFYFSLVLLKNYQQLNYTCFQKLSDKCNKYFPSPNGFRWVQRTLDGTSLYVDVVELRDMIIEVEDIFTQYITDGDRAKAMEKLRVPPLTQPISTDYVFTAGLFMAYILFVSTNQVFIFTRMFRGSFSLMLYGFSLVGNVYVWQSVGINHVLIFDLNPRHQTVSIKLLSTASFFGYACVLAMLLFIHHKEFGVKDPLYFPLIGLVLPLVILLNPVHVMNFPARMGILKCFGRVLAAPFCYVSFADFWLADQLGSLVQCTVDYYYLIRFYMRYSMDRENTFDFEPDVVIAVLRCLPAWFRLAQCVKRYCDSKIKPVSYLVNAFAYASTIIVVVISTIQMETSCKYNSIFANPWTWVYIVSSLVSTIYCTAWDLLQDYGLFKIWKGKRIFLRNRLIYPKWFYYYAIIADLSIRFFWALEVYLIANNLLLPNNSKTLSSICEINRRFIWNFLRLENEHLFNCGNFRATRDIFLSALNSRDELLVNDLMDESRRWSGAHRDSNPIRRRAE
ncbi:xenotropic and polytropic retrovirus receptor 1 homolog isoform X2 [Drosophila hydei]|uniref:Xenotropic and polytropic retrovirus receptor 1 homolog isoform X2 n=1 Tax=Drosophila hydei TaxID=7224 RepID=A0A6J1LBJ3_DROHY|nr:xenotropic and polytropic retrovirus receptor 1 homolog isoform X2 [Drosophila hydei]